MTPSANYRFDPVDIEMIRLTARLSAGMRIRRLLDTRELAVALMRSRLRQLYPDLSERDLSLKLIEDIDRAERAYRRPIITP